MRKLSPPALVIGVLALGLTVFLAVSFLPIFIREVWGPLWGAEWQRPGQPRTFGRVEPLCGVSLWPHLLAVPISSLLVLTLFLMVVGPLVLSRRS